MLKPKQKVFLDDYAITSNITKSAIKAGYSPMYADKLGKRILNGAIKAKTKELIARTEDKPLTKEEATELLCEVIGINRELLKDTLKKIAIQDKDYSSAIKILSPLAKQAIGLDINQTEPVSVTVPVLNLTFKGSDTPIITPLDTPDVKEVESDTERVL